MIERKGFVIIVVIAFLTMLLLVAWVVIDIGCSEILQTRLHNRTLAAQYVARAGAEMMYARLRHRTIITWPQTFTDTVSTRFSGGQTVGTFTATADTMTPGVFGSKDVFGIVSTSTVNGHTARVSVKCAFSSPFTNGAPVASIGPVTLIGQRWLMLRSWVRAEGPIASNSTITTNAYAQINGDIQQNQSNAAPSFWWGYNAATDTWTQKNTYDVYGNGSYIGDVNGDGVVNITDAGSDPAQQAIFNTNDINDDGVVNDKDAFVAYYTVEMDKQNLDLAPGESHYYNGNQVFGPGDVPSGRNIIFVNGNVDILFNDQNWSHSSCDHTIVSTGDITIVQPTNGSDDRLTLISYGDVNTGGVRAFGGVRGDLVVYSNSDFNAYYGGRSNGTIFAKDSAYVDTVWAIPGLLNRDLNKGKGNWADPTNKPLGLPQGFLTESLSFDIDETEQPIWEIN